MAEIPPAHRFLGGIGRALSSQTYLTYWSGQAFHVQGIWIYRLSSGWLVWELTKSPVWLGAIGFAFAAPALFIGPIGGTISDRIGHRLTAMLSLILGLMVMLVMGVSTWLELISPTGLFALVALLSMTTAFDFPARQSLISSIVDPRYFKESLALNWATFNAATFTGPLIAGFLLALGGAKLAFAVVIGTYIIMLQALWRLPPSPKANTGIPILSGLADDFRAGLRYTLKHPLIPYIVALHVVAMLFLKPYIDLMPGFAVEVFARGEQGLALLLAMSGIGGLAVSVYMTVRAETINLFLVLIASEFLGALFLVLFAATDQFWLAQAFMVAVGGMTAAAGLASSTLAQQLVDDDYRGRVLSIILALFIGAPALGALGLGWIAEQTSLPVAVISGAALALIPAAIISRKLYRLSRKVQG